MSDGDPLPESLLRRFAGLSGERPHPEPSVQAMASELLTLRATIEAMADVGIGAAHARDLPAYSRVIVAQWLRYRAGRIRSAAAHGLEPEAQERQLSRARDYEMAADEVERIHLFA